MSDSKPSDQLLSTNVAEGQDSVNPLYDDKEEMLDAIISALKLVYDPEIPVNIFDLGLIYAIDIDDIGNVDCKMTLTAPGCPVAQTFPDIVASAIESVDGVVQAEVEIVWDPPWSQDNMSEACKLELGLM